MLALSSPTLGQTTGTPVPTASQKASPDEVPIIPHGLMGTKDFKMTLHAENGDTVKVESYRGRPVLLAFWASWWGPSINTLNLIPTAVRAYGDMGVLVLAVDRERQAGTGEDFLAKHHIQVRNFHYDAKDYDAKLRAGLGGAPEFVLIDADGTVVYQNSPMYAKELHDAVHRLSQYAPPDRVQHPPANPLTDPAVLMGKAIEGEQAYAAKQANYVCNYSVRSGGTYANGRANGMEEHEDVTFFLHGGEIESGSVNSDGTVQRDTGLASVKDTYKTWTSPLLPIIQQHSILSNEHRVHERDGSIITIFTFRGDPNFAPKTDLERIARSLEGEIRIDETQDVFTFFDATAMYDVVDEDRFLLQRGLPVLEFGASLYDKVYLPMGWSVSEFQPVSMAQRNPNAAWMTTLRRNFIHRDSCQPFQTQ